MSFSHLTNHTSFVVTTLLSAVGLFLLLQFLLRRFAAAGHPAVAPLRAIRNIILPGVLILFLVLERYPVRADSVQFRVAQTALWCLIIWVLPSLFKALFFTREGTDPWRSRVPELFLDILRFSLVTVGVALVFAGVWGRDLGAFFATLGVGSIVLGLALQDTLGNLMAGIALLFERPFSVGHWIRIGETVGTVIEMNWRAVHLQTRSFDLIIVPNSVLGKEKIQNFSRPTRSHRVEQFLGFSYSDPPNKVKRVLLQVVHSTRGVLPGGSVVRTRGYKDFYVEYQVRYFIDDYERIDDIQEDFMTQVWYAVRRNSLSIPYPTRTVQKTEVPFIPMPDGVSDIRNVLQKVEILSPLSPEELEALARDAIVQDFAQGERIVQQGDIGDTLYILRTGRASVRLADERGDEHELTVLVPGQFFGEMALLTGEARSANVDAVEDVEVVTIYKSAMEPILKGRPELAEAIASVVQTRQEALARARADTHPPAEEERRGQKKELLGKIYRFFAIPA